jgi:hypothetical protein
MLFELVTVDFVNSAKPINTIQKKVLIVTVAVTGSLSLALHG